MSETEIKSAAASTGNWAEIVVDINIQNIEFDEEVPLNSAILHIC
jgi:hypothetical protein